jgi:hypothetical protein
MPKTVIHRGKEFSTNLKSVFPEFFTGACRLIKNLII